MVCLAVDYLLEWRPAYSVVRRMIDPADLDNDAKGAICGYASLKDVLCVCWRLRLLCVALCVCVCVLVCLVDDFRSQRDTAVRWSKLVQEASDLFTHGHFLRACF